MPLGVLPGAPVVGDDGAPFRLGPSEVDVGRAGRLVLIKAHLGLRPTARSGTTLRPGGRPAVRLTCWIPPFQRETRPGCGFPGNAPGPGVNRLVRRWVGGRWIGGHQVALWSPPRGSARTAFRAGGRTAGYRRRSWPRSAASAALWASGARWAAGRVWWWCSTTRLRTPTRPPAPRRRPAAGQRRYQAGQRVPVDVADVPGDGDGQPGHGDQPGGDPGPAGPGVGRATNSASSPTAMNVSTCSGQAAAQMPGRPCSWAQPNRPR